MSLFSHIGEARIDEAIASGELTPPPGGAGRLELEDYFATPESWRAAHAMLKGHGFVPPEVDALRRATELEERLRQAESPEARRSLSLELQSCRTAFALAVERLRTL